MWSDIFTLLKYITCHCLSFGSEDSFHLVCLGIVLETTTSSSQPA